ncbi:MULTISPECIES: hypothetical protein [unclassified Stenotrophomonas]|uniref:hypothetical protein n=1 Tax=unclassified Stenotrophomonas TaxID=196198 RepID=UPI000D16FC91|nr:MULTISPECIES: hypothetical protein [unclassified Stenotrophomonas]PTA70173.1 hypothetical protein C9412_19455 [Stenotrophomonas sp. Nf1]PTA75964.1 hypothetical protein C9416_18240 [Stenotrophomonas sp. Nf4]
MNATLATRDRPWGLIALVLAVVSWAGLVAAVFAFAASFGSPGDGNHGVQAMQYWILAALAMLVLSFVGSLVAMVMAWRRRRGGLLAAIAGGLLVVMMSLILMVIGASLA